MNEVEKFISDNFHAESVTVEPFPMFPQGKTVTDRNGDMMIVYFDIDRQTVIHEIAPKQPQGRTKN